MPGAKVIDDEDPLEDDDQGGGDDRKRRSGGGARGSKKAASSKRGRQSTQGQDTVPIIKQELTNPDAPLTINSWDVQPIQNLVRFFTFYEFIDHC